jgi:signal peptidase I
MGDNRANSADSRTSLGPIKKKAIIGRAFIRIWPVGRFGFFHRPKYSNAPAGALAQMAPVLVLGAGAVRRRRRAA